MSTNDNSSSHHHHHHSSSGSKPKYDDVHYMKKRRLNAIRWKKLFFKWLFRVMIALAIILVLACIIVVIID